MTRILPCPFCGSENVELFISFVTCKDCGASGPTSTSEGAIAKWNERAEVDIW